jgi:DNA adenine methylase
MVCVRIFLPKGATLVDVTVRRRSHASPLRYPGGKATLAGFFESAINALDLDKPTYIEPYAGGAGAGLELLLRGVVGMVVINDLDPAIHACWKAMLKDSEAFLKKLERTPLTIDEWRKQREIYRRRHDITLDPLALGFATFFLNRTSRSGVLGAGVIGGLNQTGTYKVDARYDKKVLKARIEKLAELSGKIRVTKQDGAARLREYLPKRNVFAYVDPPYVEKGSSLYMSAFEEDDHVALALVLNGHANTNWVLTYDVAPLIKRLYKARDTSHFRLLYSAHLRYTENGLKRASARELIVLSNAVSDALSSGF